MQTAFTTKKDYGKGEREAQWALAQRTLNGLQTSQTIFSNNTSYLELSEVAEQARKRAEIARYRIKLWLQIVSGSGLETNLIIYIVLEFPG